MRKVFTELKNSASSQSYGLPSISLNSIKFVEFRGYFPVCRILAITLARGRVFRFRKIFSKITWGGEPGKKNGFLEHFENFFGGVPDCNFEKKNPDFLAKNGPEKWS